MILCNSCKKELPFPGGENDDLIVLNSIFSTENNLEVHVSKSCFINDSLCIGNFIDDAQVILQDESGNILNNLSHQGKGIYHAENFVLNSNKTYQLEVLHSEMESVMAKSNIPKEFSCSVKGQEERLYGNDVTWEFDIEIIDNPDEENYYLLEGLIEILDGEHDYTLNDINGYIEPHIGHHSNDVNAENKSLTSGFDYVSYPLRSVFLPDENFNGQTYRTQFGLSDDDVQNPDYNDFKAHLSIKSVSEEMYNYYKSLEMYRLGQNNIFAEPEQIYSNVDGGIGVFAGFTQQTFEIDLPKSDYALPTKIFVENENCSGPCTILFSTDGGSKLNYNWDFGDGGTSSEPNPEYNYESPGQYEVTLSLSIGPGDLDLYITRVTIN